MMNKTSIKKRLQNNDSLREKLVDIDRLISNLRNDYNLPKQEYKYKARSDKYKEGISIIIPTYKGEDVIVSCLQSLVKQTLDKTLFDVHIVINGELDRTEELIEEFIKKNEFTNIIVKKSEIASASAARNIGIEDATRESILFLDDDDYLSSNYLEEMLAYSDMNTVVISQIADVDALTGHINDNNVINKQIKKASKKELLSYRELNMVLTINACKLLPTDKLKEIRYSETLKNGEDIVFFTEFFVRNQLNFHVIDPEKQVYYYRVLRKNSVSRRKLSFSFNVDDRLQVIDSLNNLFESIEEYQIEEKQFIENKIKAQSSFIQKYISHFPNDKHKVTKAVQKRHFSYFPYEIINKDEAKTLVIAYCFPPYSDTSANVMAKRLRERGEIVDVVYNKMDRVRKIDSKTNRLVNDLIDERIEISTYSSFSSWSPIEDFIEQGMKRISKSKKYNTIYSRSMWPGSHFLAFEYKRNHPDVKWVAEFSDPIRFDIHGKERNVPLESKKYLRNIKRFSKKIWKTNKWKSTNMFFWCEYLPYLFAEELIFTNSHQFNYMYDKIPHEEVQKLVKQKAIISRHPTLPKEFYTISESNYQVDQEKINIAYFGNFYKTRNLNELFIGLDKVDEKLRERIVLHIFTSNPEVLEQDTLVYESNDQIICNNYVDYLEFLNLTTKFDCLVVNDAITKEILPINPFLPSKLSDYLGSNNKIWAIYEEDSILSQMDVAYKSLLGDVEQVVKTYTQIIVDTEDKSNKNNN
jgi:poly(ribitol-phosphate) beta-N-acetylglucosaminyltransferase